MTRRTAIDRVGTSAADWAARCDAGPLAAGEQARLDAWLREDARHLGAFVRAQAVLARLDRAGGLGRHYDPHHYAVPAASAAVNHSRRRFLWRAGAGVAASAVVAVGGTALLRPRGTHHATGLGEMLRVPLPDGSTVLLDSATEIVVAFERGRRWVHLRHGQALFDVVDDVLRPFVVQAANTRVVALGTRFSVSTLADAAVDVLVSRGSVELLADTEFAAAEPLRVGADTVARVRAGRATEVEALDDLEVTRRLAWRNGMISFQGETLAEAAAEFARYSRLRLVIADKDIAARQVVGLYSATDPAGFAKAVALSMGLRARRRGDAVYLLPRSED